MRAYIIIEDSFPLEVGAIELILNTTFGDMQLDGTADWYWDDETESRIVEYGVKVDVTGIGLEEWANLTREIFAWLVRDYGDRVRMEFP